MLPSFNNIIYSDKQFLPLKLRKFVDLLSGKVLN